MYFSPILFKLIKETPTNFGCHLTHSSPQTASLKSELAYSMTKVVTSGGPINFTIQLKKNSLTSANISRHAAILT